jgi:sarcosine oxidase subunit beta
MAWESFRYFRNWAELVGGECGYVRTGFIHISRPGFQYQLRANVALHQRIGIPSLLVTAEDVSRLAPYLVTDDFEVAAFEPESGYADPSGTAKSFMDAARDRGARLVQECQVIGIEVKGGKVAAVQTNQGAFSAPIVINAAGARAADVARMVDLEIPVASWRHDTMFIHRPSQLSLPHLTVIDAANFMYFRPESGGLTLVGLEDDNPIGESPDSYIEQARPGFVERVIDRICRRMPAMEHGALHSTHGGFDGITPDQRCILDQAGPDGFYLACGFSGTGFKTAPAVGACLSELILHGEAQTVDISPFTLRRFSEGQLLKGEHAYPESWSQATETERHLPG